MMDLDFETALKGIGGLEPTSKAASAPMMAPHLGPVASAFAHLPLESLAEGLEPEIEEIRSALLAIPTSAITSEEDWMKVARALAHEAAVFKKMKESLWKLLDEVSRRAPGYDQEDNRDRFERYIGEARNSATPITIASVYHLAWAHGWQGLSRSNNSTSIADPTTVAQLPSQPRAVHVSSLPIVPPKRKWLHGTDLIRGSVSLLVAPGGRAKSTWLLVCALACASGKPLLYAHIFGGPLRVLCLSTEDGISEMSLRLRAAMKHFGLTDADVPGLYVIGADRWGFPLLRAEGNRAVLDSAGLNALTAELDHIKPDVLIIDPLIAVMGGVNANDNSPAALLMGQLTKLASERRIAIALAHHASKGRDPASAESAMGAASFINLARVALAIEPLDEKRAGEIGLAPWDAKLVFRVIPTKQNFAPPNAHDRWFRLVSIDMLNAEPPIYINGDHVAVVEPFQPGVSSSAFPHQMVRDALLVLDGANPPLTPSKRSPERYAAPVIADAIARHRSGQASETDGKALLDHLMKTGLVEVLDVKVFRSGKGPDRRKGLVLTAAGRSTAGQPDQMPPLDPNPQPPHHPAMGLRDDAGGDPLGSPATQGGCGGNAGCRNSEEDVPQEGEVS